MNGNNRFQLCAFADEADPSVDGQIRALRENGIGYIELRGVDGKGVAQLTCEEMKGLRSRLDDEGIRVWSIGSPIGKVKIDQPFDEHFDLFRRTLELTALSGAQRMRVFSFYEAVGRTQQVIDRLGQMLEAAQYYGILLCHENEKGVYGDLVSRCVELHKALPQLRGVFDPANFVQCGQDTLQAWERLEPYIDYIHMKDALADGTVVPPGEGDGNVRAILANYAAKGGGIITLEPHLAEFVGLAGLEREGEKSGIACRYTTEREAFDVAVNALKAML